MSECTKPQQEDTCKYSETAAKEAVKQVFAILGVDIDDPRQVKEFQKDLMFGQAMRKAADRGQIVFAGIVVSALAYALFAGIVEKIGGK
jgi:hypothetical protein